MDQVPEHLIVIWVSVLLASAFAAALIVMANKAMLQKKLTSEALIGTASVIDAYEDPSDGQKVIKYRFIHPTTHRQVESTAVLPSYAPLPSSGSGVKVKYLADTDKVHELFDDSRPSYKKAA